MLRRFLREKLLHDIARDHHTCARRDPRHRARRRTLVRFLTGKLSRRKRQLFAGEHGVVLDPARPELSPHDLGQRAAGGFAQVGNPEFRGVEPVSGSHRADDRNAPRDGRLDEVQFAARGVDAVGNVAKAAGKESSRVSGS